MEICTARPMGYPTVEEVQTLLDRGNSNGVDFFGNASIIYPDKADATTLATHLYMIGIKDLLGHQIQPIFNGSGYTLTISKAQHETLNAFLASEVKSVAVEVIHSGPMEFDGMLPVGDEPPKVRGGPMQFDGMLEVTEDLTEVRSGPISFDVMLEVVRPLDPVVHEAPEKQFGASPDGVYQRVPFSELYEDGVDLELAHMPSRGSGKLDGLPILPDEEDEEALMMHEVTLQVEVKAETKRTHLDRSGLKDSARPSSPSPVQFDQGRESVTLFKSTNKLPPGRGSAVRNASEPTFRSSPLSRGSADGRSSLPSFGTFEAIPPTGLAPPKMSFSTMPKPTRPPSRLGSHPLDRAPTRLGSLGMERAPSRLGSLGMERPLSRMGGERAGSGVGEVDMREAPVESSQRRKSKRSYDEM